MTASTTDGKTTRVSWAQKRDAAHPVSASGIERYDNQSKTWVRVGTVQGTGTAWSDTSLPAGRATYYRVWAWNGRESARAQSATVWTTPTAATNVRAVKDAAGNITVSWVKTVLHNEGSYDIYDNGVLIGSTAENVTSFVHRSPDPAAAHTYTVVTRTPNGLRSAMSAASPAVQVLGAPSAPTVLGPTGTVSPGRVVLSWRHNPVDSTAQTAARVEVRRVVSALSTELVQVIEVTGAAQTAALTLPVGQYMWTVRTRGMYDGGAAGDSAAWSPAGGGLGSPGQFRVATPPVVGITVPGPVVGTASTQVAWSYSQAEGHAQSSAVVELVELVDGVPSGPVESVSVSGAGASVAMSSRLPHGSAWQVTVTVTSAVRQTATARVVVSVVYPSPPAPVVEAVWDESRGAMSLALANPAPLPVSERVVSLVPDPLLARPQAWDTPGGALSVSGGSGDGWAQAVPVVPSWGCRLSLADPVPVVAGQQAAWSVDVAAAAPPEAEDTLLLWTSDWWVNAEVTKTASEVSTSTAAVSGNNGRIGTSTRPLPGGRTYRLAMLVSCEADCYVDMGAYYMTTAGAYSRSLWPANNRKQLSAGTDRQLIWVDLPITYRAGEDRLQCIAYLRAGGRRLVVHDAVVLDVTGQDTGAPAEPAAPSLAVSASADGSTAVLDGAAVSVSADGATVVVDGAATSADGATAIVDTTAAPVAVPGVDVADHAVVSVEVAWLGPDGTVLAVTSEPAAPGAAPAGGVRAVVAATVPAGAVAARPAVVCQGATLWVRRPLLTTATSPAGLVTEWWDPAGPYAQLGGQSYAVSVSADGTTSVVPNSPPAARNRVSRSVDGGTTWEPLDAEVPLDYATSDPLALSYGETMYRAEAVSADGASAATVVAAVADSQAMWIGGGPAYTTTAPLYGDPAHALDVDLAERDTAYFAGRRLPVELAGTQEARSLSVSATLDDDDMAILDTLAALAVLPGPVVYRDPVGRRMWCSMSGLRLPRDYRGGIWGVSLDLVEVDPDD
ncbi:hypothetical protein [Actinomyces sp. 432]|uniref:hypothetical protein n=1 Tax=Actinomyces sp. 432 TaxID=2057798 RepID=UPI00137AB766|nr:hypothetical protein [Actinomyces sp. 432]